MEPSSQWRRLPPLGCRAGGGCCLFAAAEHATPATPVGGVRLRLSCRGTDISKGEFGDKR
jgi:hypothetical protein